MPCYSLASDGSFATERTAHLSEEIDASVRAEVRREYESEVAARLKRQQEEFERASVAQKAELTRMGLSLRRREGELGRRESALASQESVVALAGGEVERRREELAEQGRRLGKSAAEVAIEKATLAGLASDLAGRRLAQERTGRELRSRELELEREGRMVRKREAELTARERGLDERKRNERAAELRRRQEAEARVAALEAGVGSCGDVVTRWREKGRGRVKAAVSKARRLLADGDLPRVHVAVERATADLEEIEKRAFEDERLEEGRKRGAGILVAALRRVGFLRVGARARSPDDPRGLVDVAGAMPSGKTVVFTLHHDGRMEIRQAGVSGHRECHSIEDAIAAAAGGMGLSFRGGHQATVHGGRPAARAVRAAARSPRLGA